MDWLRNVYLSFAESRLTPRKYSQILIFIPNGSVPPGRFVANFCNEAQLPVCSIINKHEMFPSSVQQYQKWLKRQPAGFQDEVLGKTKGALFRRGGVGVDKFVDMRSGRSFTLDELKNREGQAFMKANIKV